MDSRWSDEDAAACVARYAPDWGEALALRVYSSRLIGADPGLVLHGGGNTSVKDTVQDLLGEAREAIFVKGSGWDLGGIEPQGLPGLDLPGLRRLRGLADLTDEEMVNQLRIHLFRADAPNPSVETLLHAFLPHRFVDHSHADAILALSNQEEGPRHVEEALGARVVSLPFVMPGFPLAKAVAEAYEAQPDCEGVLLHQHGLFTFGETARESYERHVSLVDAAERHLERATRTSVTSAAAGELARASARAATLAPALRGALLRCARSGPGAGASGFVVRWEATSESLAWLAAEGAQALFETPVLTPDHALRVKTKPCWLELDLDSLDRGEVDAEAIASAVEDFAAEQAASFERGVAARGPRQPIDRAPRIVLVPGVGMFAAGTSAKAAAIASDLGRHTLRTKAWATALGPYRGLPELDLFDMEFWPLEQAKLGKTPPAALAGQVAVVTGGAGAIGEGVARVLARAGAVVWLLDVDGDRAEAVAARLRDELGAHATRALQADVTDAESLDTAFAEICRHCGGVDVVVPNAGIAAVASIVDEDPQRYRHVVEVNQVGTFLTLRAGARVMKTQGTGGSVVLVSSKNVLGPGADFGAYSSSKAGAHQLGRVAALELAAEGIHVNMVCPDAVFRCGERASGLWAEVGPERAASRGLSAAELEDFYVQRSLLKRRVHAEEVGEAVLFFASRRTPTTGALLPVDGGVAAAFPR